MWMPSPPEFIDWIEESRRAEGWSIRELARRTGLTASYISKVLNGQRSAGKDLCAALARVFRVSDVFVFRLADLLESKLELDHRTEVALGLFRNLSEPDQDRIIAMLRAFATMDEIKDSSTKGE